MTHAVDLPGPQQPGAQAKEGGDVSMFPAGPRKAITPQDTSKAAPPQSVSEQAASVSQGRGQSASRSTNHHSESILKC